MMVMPPPPMMIATIIMDRQVRTHRI